MSPNRKSHKASAAAGRRFTANVWRAVRAACLTVAACLAVAESGSADRIVDAAEPSMIRQAAWLEGSIDDSAPRRLADTVEPVSAWVELAPVEVTSGEATNLADDDEHLELLSGSDLETPDDWSFRSSAASWWQRVKSDHCHFYSGESLGRLAIGTAVAGVMANTNIDRSIHDAWRTNLASHSDWYDVFHSPKPLGNGIYTLPAFGIAWAAGAVFDDNRSGAIIGEWGERSLRTFVVGAPPLIMMQQLTGGSRPGETTHHSQWRPFQDDNGASGHSFMGALPFLSAAKMTDEPWLKAAFYIGSTATGISRVNNGDHYASQAVLGWWIAYLAADAVDRTQADSSVWTLTAYPDPYTTGVALAIEY